MFEELDTVVLRRDLVEHGLRAGDVGAVVHCYPNASGYEVEFVTAGGQTIALVTLEPSDIRRMEDGEILHARIVDRLAA